MYQQRSSGLPPRDSRLTQRQLFYLSRNLRAAQNGGNQQAASEEVRTQRQPPTAPVVQGRGGTRSGSIKSQLPQTSSTLRSQENPQDTSNTQDHSSDLETYISDNFIVVEQQLSDLADRIGQLIAKEEALHKTLDLTLPNLTDQIAHLILKVEAFHKAIESATALAPEGMDADVVDLGDMASLVNF